MFDGGLDFSFCFNSYFFTGTTTFVIDVVGWLDALTVVTLGEVDVCFLTRGLDVKLGFSFGVAMRFSFYLSFSEPVTIEDVNRRGNLRFDQVTGSTGSLHDLCKAQVLGNLTYRSLESSTSGKRSVRSVR